MEILFKFVGAAACGTDAFGKTWKVFGFGHFNEGHHFRCWEAYEVQRAYPVTHALLYHLQVLVPQPRLTIRHITGEVFTYGLQDLHLLLLLLVCNVCGLEVDQFGQGATNVHTKPWHHCNQILTMNHEKTHRKPNR